MKISFAPLAGPAWGTPVTLCDGSATEGPQSAKLDGKNVVDITPVLQADQPAFHDRGNRTHTYQFKVRKFHTALVDAQAAMLQFSASLPGFGLLNFIPDAPGESDGSALYAIAALMDFNFEDEGISVLNSFNFTLGLITTSVPDPPGGS